MAVSMGSWGFRGCSRKKIRRFRLFTPKTWRRNAAKNDWLQQNRGYNNSGSTVTHIFTTMMIFLTQKDPDVFHPQKFDEWIPNHDRLENVFPFIYGGILGLYVKFQRGSKWMNALWTPMFELKFSPRRNFHWGINIFYGAKSVVSLNETPKGRNSPGMPPQKQAISNCPLGLVEIMHTHKNGYEYSILSLWGWMSRNGFRTKF